MRDLTHSIRSAMLVVLGAAAAFAAAGCASDSEPSLEVSAESDAQLSTSSTTRLAPADLPHGANFGADVAVLSPTIVAVGAAREGAAYVLRRTRAGWEEDARFESGALSDQFGTTVAGTHGTLWVGSPDAAAPYPQSGEVRVFRSTAKGWVPGEILRAGDPAPQSQFGSRVAVEGELAAIAGAPSASAQVHVYRDADGVITPEATLRSSSPADGFGRDLAVDDGRVMVGASEAAYLFRRMRGAWIEHAKLAPTDRRAGDRFGASVALEADIAVVGATHADRDPEVDSDEGAVYVFKWIGSAWVEDAKLFAPDGEYGDEFGNSVAIASGRLFVGAPFQRGRRGVIEAGAIHEFVRAASGWERVAVHRARNPRQSENLGASLAAAGALWIAGAPQSIYENELGAGSVLVPR